jgi:glycosyltransferase involved in cell wall biosynthesis
MLDKMVSIIIPALNEEKTIAQVIDEISGAGIQNKGYKVEILVVDNNSTDRTGEIARGKSVRVVIEHVKGKGRAVRTALESVNGDFVFMLDADYTYPATYIPSMLDILRDGHDVVMCSRLKGKIDDGAMSKINMLGNHLLTWMANLLYRTRISDLCTGYWGFNRNVVDSLKLDAEGFELEATLFAEIARKGYRIGEVPINYRRRIAPDKLNSLKDGLRIGWMLLTRRFRSR